MTLLVRSALLVDPASPYHLQELDMLVEGDRISKLGTGLVAAPDSKDVVVLERSGLCISPGWMDSFAHFCDPGEEHRENLQSGAAAAAAGGFTAVAIAPNTDPPLHGKAELEYIRSRTQLLPVHIFPYGSVSRGTEGKDIAELNDLHEAGAIGFTDGIRPLAHAGLMANALRYVQPFNGLILNTPLNRDMAGRGTVHEGLVALRLGLPGIPGMAEALMVQRDLQLLEYTGGRIHFSLISSHRSVDLIREAKSKGLEVSAGVAAYQLLYDDQNIGEFDALYKVMPPLRAPRDRESLIGGLLDGTIDLVCSNHIPRHLDQKRLEFEYASYGINGLETAFSTLRMALGDALKPAQLVQWFSVAPRTLFDLPQPAIREGERAELTFFRPDATWTPEPIHWQSLSFNNPQMGQTLTGVVDGIYSKGRFIPHHL